MAGTCRRRRRWRAAGCGEAAAAATGSPAAFSWRFRRRRRCRSSFARRAASAPPQNHTSARRLIQNTAAAAGGFGSGGEEHRVGRPARVGGPPAAWSSTAPSSGGAAGSPARGEKGSARCYWNRYGRQVRHPRIRSRALACRGRPADRVAPHDTIETGYSTRPRAVRLKVRTFTSGSSESEPWSYSPGARGPACGSRRCQMLGSGSGAPNSQDIRAAGGGLCPQGPRGQLIYVGSASAHLFISGGHLDGAAR